MQNSLGRDIELLAPAGGWEQLRYALRFGADAVYLACGRFGMRQRAQNFSLDEIGDVVALAHDAGAKVHVTANIVMHEKDLLELPGYFEALQEAGVDAFIIGDLGALALARKHAPNVEVHVSTQASVSNAEAARIWHDLGASRIVCAREMSLESIATMRRELPPELELEAFVHGAMCMAYSGRCLISDYLTGRSALEGHCTQPCRWKWGLVEETRPGQVFPIEETDEGAFILNSKDLNMLAHLQGLADAGVDSIKIEGRNKKAYYVATVTGAYRRVLDGEDPEVVARELEAVSHRPYATGFYFGPAHQTPESDEYVRGWSWAAHVEDCKQVADDTWEATIVCRNRFSADDELEVVSPGVASRPLGLDGLWHLPVPTEDDPTPAPVATDLANRAMERYKVRCHTALLAHDIIRVKR